MSKKPPYVRHRVPIMIDGVLYIGRQHSTGSAAGSCSECSVNRNWHASDSEEDQLFYMKYKLTGGEP